jgi:choline dehydrogenase
MQNPLVESFDYVVVGSGAGGAPLAANLAEAGFSVLVLEAGFDPVLDHDPVTRAHTEVPAFHGQASIDRNLSWDFFVEHYAPNRRSPDAPNRPMPADSKRVEGKGILYPRASAIGGCTSHHAMITMYPHNADWDNLQRLTGDATWSSAAMRSYYERQGHEFYVQKWLQPTFADPRVALRDRQLLKVLLISSLHAALHAAAGPGQREQADRLVEAGRRFLQFVTTIQPRIGGIVAVARFGQIVVDLQAALVAYQEARVRALRGGGQAVDQQRAEDLFRVALNNVFEDLLDMLQNHRDVQDIVADLFTAHDPNAIDFVRANLPGIYATPVSIREGKRHGPRERLLAAAARFPRLRIQKGAFVTKLNFVRGGPSALPRVASIDYCITDRQRPVYRASPLAPIDSALPDSGMRTVNVGREAILCAGAFNTPQILMLSGIGPQAQLAARQITPVVVREGVGKNLQDRYEVTVVSEFPQDFRILNSDCDFASPAGPCYERWRDHHDGVYATNGVTLSVVLKSTQAAATAPPDLFVFGIPGDFHGYYPNYGNDLVRNDANFRNRRHFTWAILKGHTRNKTGTVELRSANPLDTPLVDFNYFGDQPNATNPDLLALQEAFEFVRGMNRQMAGLHATEVAQPASIANPNGPRSPVPQTPQEIRTHLMKEAWGHHACGTCKMGRPDDALAVVDSRFKVIGVGNLRIVDASVFPEIPGFFIALPIYMISEKASRVIIEAARGGEAAVVPMQMPPAP